MEKSGISDSEPTGNGNNITTVFQSPYWLLTFTALSVFISEVMVMLILALLPPMRMRAEAFLDGLLLTVFIFPFLYLLMFRPMIRQIRIRYRAEKDLQETNRVLEERVESRTAEIEEKNNLLRMEVENRKRAEKAAKKNEAFLLQVVETLPALMWVVDLKKGRCTFVNSRMEEILGFSSERIYLMGDRFMETLFGTKDFCTAAGLGSRLYLAEEGEVVESLGRMTHANGHELEFRIRTVVLEKKEDQTPSSVLCMAEKRAQGEN